MQLVAIVQNDMCMLSNICQLFYGTMLLYRTRFILKYIYYLYLHDVTAIDIEVFSVMWGIYLVCRELVIMVWPVLCGHTFAILFE